MSDEAYFRSGNWSTPAQVILMLVMFLGRLRGLPDSIDPAVRFSTEQPEEPISGTNFDARGVKETVIEILTGYSGAIGGRSPDGSESRSTIRRGDTVRDDSGGNG